MIDYAEFIMAQLKTKAGEREAIEVSVWKKFREIMNHRASLRRRKELYVLTWKSFVTIIYSVLKHGTKNAKKMGVQNKNKNRNYHHCVWNLFGMIFVFVSAELPSEGSIMRFQLVWPTTKPISLIFICAFRSSMSAQRTLKEKKFVKSDLSWFMHSQCGIFTLST